MLFFIAHSYYNVGVNRVWRAADVDARHITTVGTMIGKDYEA